jgi:hypothetical protein
MMNKYKECFYSLDFLLYGTFIMFIILHMNYHINMHKYYQNVQYQMIHP